MGLSYFPLIIDRWIAGTRHLSLEETGAYIQLLVYLYEHRDRYIKDEAHVARILQCRLDKARRIWNGNQVQVGIKSKFTRFKLGFYHSLTRDILRNGGKISRLRKEHLPPDPDPDLDLSLPSLLSQDSCSQSMEEKALVASEKLATPDSPKNGKRQKKIPDCPHQEIIDMYHQRCPKMPRIRKDAWKEHRQRPLRAMWKEHPDLEWWDGYLTFCGESDFLNGKNNRNWLANFDWLIAPRNFCKIHEGKYHGLR